MGQTVQAGLDHLFQRLRHLNLRLGLNCLPPAIPLNQDFTFDQLPNELLNIERIPLGPFLNQLPDCLGNVGQLEQVFNQFLARWIIQRDQCQMRIPMGEVGLGSYLELPTWFVPIGPEEKDQQNRGALGGHHQRANQSE